MKWSVGITARLCAVLLACAAHYSAIASEPAVQPELSARELMERTERRLAAEPTPEDVHASRSNLMRILGQGQPSIRLSQSASLSYGGESELGLDLSLSLPVEDEEARVRADLARQRLALALHNQAAGKRYRLHEFGRGLLLLGHLQRVISHLEAHRSELLERWPSLRDWNVGNGPAAATGIEIGYLELVQALARAQGEREVLGRSLARQSGVPAEQLTSARLDPDWFLPQSDNGEEPQVCAAETDELERAELLAREQELLDELAVARREARTTFVFDGGVHYRQGAHYSPWDLRAQASLRIALPPTPLGTATLTLGTSPAGVSQQLSLVWPTSQPPPTPGEGKSATDSGARMLGQANAEAGLAVVRAANSLRDARSSVLIDELRLANLENLVTVTGRNDAETLSALVQARVELSTARLELALARLDLARACGFDYLHREGREATP